MSVRLTLICQGASAATRANAFPADEGLDAPGAAAAARLAGAVRRVDAAWCGPGRAARETAAAAGIPAREDLRLREIDYGRWAGQGLDAVDPAALGDWLGDPAAAPHGGESIEHAVARMAAWMAGLAAGRVLAVVPPSLARAAVVTALRAPLAAFWRIDAMPLGRLVLSGRGGVWSLQSLERPSRPEAGKPGDDPI